jgi:hypothetical protein
MSTGLTQVTMRVLTFESNLFTKIVGLLGPYHRIPFSRSLQQSFETLSLESFSGRGHVVNWPERRKGLLELSIGRWRA